MDIPDQRDEIGVVETKNRFIPGLEKMAFPRMPGIESDHVRGQKTVHDMRERRSSDFDREMEMITHEAVGDNRAICLRF